MTIDQWIDVASSAGTVIAAIIAAISVLVIRNQNKKQHLPRITIADTKYETSSKENKYWSSEYWVDDTGSDKKYARLKILNVGNGIATHIKIRWLYNRKDLLNLANYHLSDHGYVLLASDDEHKIIVINKICDEDDGRKPGPVFGTLSAYATGIDFISPVTSQPNGHEIQVDGTLQTLSSLILRALQNSPDQAFLKLKRTILLEVSYMNNLGEHFKEIITMQLSLINHYKNAGEDFKRAIFKIERIQ